MLLPSGHLDPSVPGIPLRRRFEMIAQNFAAIPRQFVGDNSHIFIDQTPGSVVVRFGDTGIEAAAGGIGGGGGGVSPIVTGTYTFTCQSSMDFMVDPTDTNCFIPFYTTATHRLSVTNGVFQGIILAFNIVVLGTKKIQRCAGQYSDSSGSSDPEEARLDRWRRCGAGSEGSASDDEDIFLSPSIFDSIPADFEEPVIQLDGIGLCYYFVNRNEAGETQPAYTTILVLEGCDDVNCEEPTPCSCPDSSSKTYKIDGYTDGMFGSLVTSGPTNCGSAGSSPRINGQNITGTSCSYSVAGLTSPQKYMDASGGANTREVEVTQVSVILRTDDIIADECYWSFTIQFTCSGTKQLNYRKAFGPTAAGVYTLQTTDTTYAGSTAAILANSTGIPTTITIAVQ